MPQVNNIEHLREWFRACPHLNDRNRLRVDYISEKPTEYSIFATPSTKNYRENVLGELVLTERQTQNYVFMSRNHYGSDTVQNIETEGWYQDIIEWILEQNRLRNFPGINEGEVVSVTATLTVQVVEASPDNALYQIPISITYKVYD